MAATDHNNRLMKEASEEKLTEVERELFQFDVELRKLTMEKRKVGPRVSGTSRVGVDRRIVSGIQRSEGDSGALVGRLGPESVWRGPRFCQQCWRFAEKEEGSGVERVG